MNIPGLLALKNRMNVAKWLWRWHLQGGCMHWRARDLEDRRTDDLRERGRRIETQVREAVREQRRGKRVANLAVLRLQRGLRKARHG